jgi:hypothetical protein
MGVIRSENDESPDDAGAFKVKGEKEAAQAVASGTTKAARTGPRMG